MAMDWFRWHHGSVTDPKFQLAARRAGASLPDVLAVWAYILEQASAHEDRGYFGCMDAEALDVLFNFPNTETRTADILKSLEMRGLTKDGRIVRWEKRQPKRERDDPGATDRKRNQREREASQDQVTPSHATSRHVTPRLDESRGDKKEERERRATRLPKDFEPTPEPEAEQGIDRPKELANFRDYWTAKSGKDATKLDWQATWRTWARRAHRNPADQRKTTVPGPVGRDPALKKLDEDDRQAAPIPLAQLERMAKIRQGVH